MRERPKGPKDCPDSREELARGGNNAEKTPCSGQCGWHVEPAAVEVGPTNRGVDKGQREAKGGEADAATGNGKQGEGKTGKEKGEHPPHDIRLWKYEPQEEEMGKPPKQTSLEKTAELREAEQENQEHDEQSKLGSRRQRSSKSFAGK